MRVTLRKLDAPGGRMSFKFLLFLAAIASLIPLAAVGWKDLAPVLMRSLEYNPPVITIAEMPRGVGLLPVNIKINLTDDGAGLDEIIVRTTQRGIKRELLRKALEGKSSTSVTVEFPGERTDLEEGTAFLEIRAFDRSFWNNAAERNIPLEIDFRKPKIEVLSSQHNAVAGGSQFIMYKAYDENLAVSGVKVGAQTFLGYPARGMDSVFNDAQLFAGIYAIDMNAADADSSVRAFAEDKVGNAISTPFYNKVSSRTFRKVTQKVTEEFLRDRIASLADENLQKLRDNSGQKYESKKAGTERLIEQFQLVNQVLREINRSELAGLLKGPRFERFWDGPFAQQPGTILGAYGDRVSFTYDNAPIGEMVREGYEFGLPPDHSDVFAANSGVIIFSENLGVYGRCVAIDHGLGLTSFYGFLDNIVVNRGDSVTIGQKIGSAGQSGFARGTKLYFEIRVHGIPVDPREWWDMRWFYAHVTAKLNEVKRTLGMPVYKPLE